MEPIELEKEFCINCRWLSCRVREDKVRTYFWCRRKAEDLGPVILGVEACEDYVPWTVFPDRINNVSAPKPTD